MRPFLGLIALLLPLAASADQITATLVDQTLSTSASANLPGVGYCSQVGTASASCSVGGVIASASIGSGSYYGGPYPYGGGTVSATGTYGFDALTGGVGDARLSGTILITGGSGTGFLEIHPYASVVSDQIGGATVMVNNQYISDRNSYFGWSQVPFTFGQPFGYSLDVWSTYLTNTLSAGEVRVYAYQPDCSYTDGCTDPNYLSISSLFMAKSVSGGITQTPEPATMCLAGLALSALVIFRRF